MASNVQEFLDIINEDYNKTKQYYENLLMDSYIKGDDSGINRLLDTFVKYSIRKQYKPTTGNLTFEFNLNSVTENAKGIELGDNEFVLTMPEVVKANHIKFKDGLPKERADKLIVLVEKYFANNGDTLKFSSDRKDYIYMDVQFDFEKYRPHFVEQLQEILNNKLKNGRFEFETTRSNKGVIITIKPDYYNLDTAFDLALKSSDEFSRKVRMFYKDDTYMKYAADIISSMTSYIAGATPGRIKGDYELKVPVNYNAEKLGFGINREGDGLELVARSLYEGFSDKQNAFTEHLEQVLSTSFTRIAFNSDGSFGWLCGESQANVICDYAASRIAGFVELYCKQNNIPVHTYADSKGLTITINNSDLAE